MMTCGGRLRGGTDLVKAVDQSRATVARCWLSALSQAAALRHVRPGDFESFAAFASWRRHAGRLLIALLVSAASTSADRGPRDAGLDPAGKTRVARCARLRLHIDQAAWLEGQ